MSYKLVATGQLALVDESSGSNILAFDLSEILTTITGIQEQNFSEQQISSADGVVALNLNGVSTVKAFIVYVVGGAEDITVKHNSNTNGIVTNGTIIFGAISTVTIETASTQSITVKFIAVQ